MAQQRQLFAPPALKLFQQNGPGPRPEDLEMLALAQQRQQQGKGPGGQANMSQANQAMFAAAMQANPLLAQSFGLDTNQIAAATAAAAQARYAAANGANAPRHQNQADPRMAGNAVQQLALQRAAAAASAQLQLLQQQQQQAGGLNQIQAAALLHAQKQSQTLQAQNMLKAVLARNNAAVGNNNGQATQRGFTPQQQAAAAALLAAGMGQGQSNMQGGGPGLAPAAILKQLQLQDALAKQDALARAAATNAAMLQHHQQQQHQQQHVAGQAHLAELIMRQKMQDAVTAASKGGLGPGGQGGGNGGMAAGGGLSPDQIRQLASTPGGQALLRQLMAQGALGTAAAAHANNQNNRNMGMGAGPPTQSNLANNDAQLLNTLVQQLQQQQQQALQQQQLQQQQALQAQQLQQQQQLVQQQAAGKAAAQAAQAQASGMHGGLNGAAAALAAAMSAAANGGGMSNAASLGNELRNSLGSASPGSQSSAAASATGGGAAAASKEQRRLALACVALQLARSGVSVDQAIQSGIMGGMSVVDVRFIVECYNAERERMAGAGTVGGTGQNSSIYQSQAGMQAPNPAQAQAQAQQAYQQQFQQQYQAQFQQAAQQAQQAQQQQQQAAAMATLQAQHSSGYLAANGKQPSYGQASNGRRLGNGVNGILPESSNSHVNGSHPSSTQTSQVHSPEASQAGSYGGMFSSAHGGGGLLGSMGSGLLSHQHLLGGGSGLLGLPRDPVHPRHLPVNDGRRGSVGSIGAPANNGTDDASGPPRSATTDPTTVAMPAGFNAFNYGFFGEGGGGGSGGGARDVLAVPGPVATGGALLGELEPEGLGGMEDRALEAACLGGLGLDEEPPSWLSTWEGLNGAASTERRPSTSNEIAKVDNTVVAAWPTNEDLAARLANLDLGSGFM